MLSQGIEALRKSPPYHGRMLSISVDHDIAKAAAKIRSITEAQQLRFATAKALTQTAVQVQQEVRKNMPSRFQLRRQWVVQGIRVDRATKQNLVATVYSRDKFMGLQEAGGNKSPLRNYLAIPTSMVRRTPSEIVRQSDKPKALGDKVEIVTFRGEKYLALKKPRKGANGQRLRFLYLLVPRAKLEKRLGLEKDGNMVVRRNFAANLQQALDEAVKTAR